MGNGQLGTAEMCRMLKEKEDGENALPRVREEPLQGVKRKVWKAWRPELGAVVGETSLGEAVWGLSLNSCLQTSEQSRNADRKETLGSSASPSQNASRSPPGGLGEATR